MSEWAACRAVASATGAAPLKVGVQFDTGLTRLGIPAADAQTLGRNSLAGLEVVMWVAQLSRFDQADAAECLAERACFERLTADLPKAGRSLAASACVFADAVWHLEHARVGSALYGVATGPGLQGRLEPAVELRARVLRVMDVPAGTGVGYGGEWVAREPSTLATLAIGYGHGLPATFGEGGAVVAAGRLAPLVGGVAMGLCTADVSFMAPGALRVGDWVEIYGRQRPVHEAALAARLTPNALMTPTAKLARRVYKGCGLVEAGQ
jgi:alanine racemase